MNEPNRQCGHPNEGHSPVNFPPIPEFKKHLDAADTIICAFSGGKDSVATVCQLMEWGYTQKLEIWHQNVDGAEHEPSFFDWPCTPDYVRAFASAFKLPVYFSYREGGFYREAMRFESKPAPIHFQTPDGSWVKRGGKHGNVSTKRMFPAVHNDLSKRWCSSYLKISPMAMAIRNQPRFNRAKTVVVTGERRQESNKRASYNPIALHVTNATKILSRSVTHLRPILDYDEQTVWDIIRAWCIQPHVAYEIGLGRCSCRTCVFQDENDLAIVAKVDEDAIALVEATELELGHTIAYNAKLDKQLTVRDRAMLGSKEIQIDPKWVAQAKSKTWDQPIIVPSCDWRLPPGAYSRSSAGSP